MLSEDFASNYKYCYMLPDTFAASSLISVVKYLYPYGILFFINVHVQLVQLCVEILTRTKINAMEYEADS